jgi:glycerol uptake facilitator-like aquaporin
MRKRFPWKAVAGMLFALMLGAAIAAHELGILK